MKVTDWAFQWKMRFNSDSKKQAQKLMFSRKVTAQKMKKSIMETSFFVQ